MADIVLTITEQSGVEVPVTISSGQIGSEGPSAYQVAVANGFVGTEEEWLASLVGPQGAPGEGGGGGDHLDSDHGDAFEPLGSVATHAGTPHPSSAQLTKLDGIATGATANASDAELRDRATHTGTQTSATIADFAEAVQDAVAALLGEGTNITLIYDDVADTLTIASTGGGTTDPEAVRDAIGVALVGVGNISVAVDDALDTITISTTATANATDAALRDRASHTGSQAIATITGLQAALDAKYAPGGTDVSVADGGTGASDAPTARTNLGIADDPAAETAGMRTLGTGATQAAPGDHAHAGAAALAMVGNQVKLVYLTTAVSGVGTDGFYFPDETAPTLTGRVASITWEGTSAQIPAQGTGDAQFQVGDTALVRTASL